MKYEPKTWTFCDRSRWTKGPWDEEPEDKVQWVDEATGLDCLAHRNGIGAWCGYVGVPEGHALHGVEYNDVYERDDYSLAVHGGLTFSDYCAEGGGEGRGICHVPYEGRPEKVWWLGFDCAHSGDQIPGYPEAYRHLFNNGAYRTLDYVKGQCRQLAAQLGK